VILASSWSTIVDVAAGALGVIILGLLRVVTRLGERVARLEAIEESRRSSSSSEGVP
jgi:hypothetical protein